LLKLSEISEIAEVPAFSDDAKVYLQGLIDDFSENDVKEIKNFERITNHDVKAVEYFLKQKCQANAEIAKVVIYFY
jgi:adenylosuccinate lyase